MQIKFESVNHIYNANTPMEQRALYDINFDIKDGQFLAIVGHTGSGKSTLIQHMNGLLKPSSGSITIGEKVIKPDEKNKGLKEIRQYVGLVFQFPEYQLFEETVEKDIMFGPMNYGVSEEEAKVRAHDVIKMVGLDESVLSQSPFNLSGGQMRRVAIAGILAMDPEIIVLDEPTAGLDPQGAKQMMGLFEMLNKKHGKTILVVTHDMEHVLDYCDEVVVVEHGKIAMHVSKEEFFEDASLMEKANINPPAIIRMRTMLQEKGFAIPNTVLSIEALVKALKKGVA